MASQANLASGLAAAQQDSRAKIESFRTRQVLQRIPRDHLCLVESALCLLAGMQGNGNDPDRAGEECPNGHRLFQLGNRLGQHASQNRRRGTNLLKLEQMDQVAQFPVIATIGDRPLERRIRALAEQASRLNVNAIRLSAIRLSAIRLS